MNPTMPFAAIGLSTLLVTGAFAADARVLAGKNAFTSWERDAPGVTRLIRPADLPRPFATEAGTLTAAAHELKVMGAKRIFAFATHGLFSGPGHARIAASDLEKVVVCNSIPLQSTGSAEEDLDKIVQVSIAGLLADAIRRIHLKKSVSALFTHNQSKEVPIVQQQTAAPAPSSPSP